MVFRETSGGLKEDCLIPLLIINNYDYEGEKLLSSFVHMQMSSVAHFCLDMAMRCVSDLLQSLVHHKYETLCFDLFTHEWKNLQEHCELYLLTFMQPFGYLEIISNNQTHLSLAKIDLLPTTNKF